MGISIIPIRENDLFAVHRIYNYFIEYSYAAFSEKPVSVDYITQYLKSMKNYPVKVVIGEKKVIGYGFLKPLLPHENVIRSAYIGYFLMPNSTGLGIGSQLLQSLIQSGKQIGVEQIIAQISSLNDASINFHKKHHFVETGTIPNAGIKWERFFDIIYMRKTII